MSDRWLISSGSPFETAFGYSRAVVRGDEVLISGTTGYDYARMAMPDGVADQTRNIYATFAAVMGQAGGELADIVRLRTFVTDPAYCEAALKVQGEVFGAIRPAATIVVVPALFAPEMKVEIEAEARLRPARRLAVILPAPPNVFRGLGPRLVPSPSRGSEAEFAGEGFWGLGQGFEDIEALLSGG